jgi:hypothetical protein
MNKGFIAAVTHQFFPFVGDQNTIQRLETA